MSDKIDPKAQEPFDTLKGEISQLLTEISSNEDLTREELEELNSRKNQAIAIYLSQTSTESLDDANVDQPYFDFFTMEIDEYLEEQNLKVVSWIADCDDEQLSKVLCRRVSDYLLSTYLATGQYEEIGNILSQKNEISDLLTDDEKIYISNRIYLELRLEIKSLIDPPPGRGPIENDDRMEKIQTILHFVTNPSIFLDTDYYRLRNDIQNTYFQKILGAFEKGNSHQVSRTYSEVKSLAKEGFLDDELVEEIYEGFLMVIYLQITNFSAQGKYRELRGFLEKPELNYIFPKEVVKDLVYDAYTFFVTNIKEPSEVFKVFTEYSTKAKGFGFLTERELGKLRKRSLEVLPQKLMALLEGNEPDKHIQLSRFFAKDLYGLRVQISEQERALILRSFYNLLCKRIATITSEKIYKELNELPDTIFQRYEDIEIIKTLLFFHREAESISVIVDNEKPQEFLNNDDIKYFLNSPNSSAFIDVMSIEVQKKLGNKILTVAEFAQWANVLQKLFTMKYVRTVVCSLSKMNGNDGNMTIVKMLNDKSFPRDILDEIIDEYAKALERNSH